ncbi:hypothetical protein ['Cynodon dactylon' phytoplasma]|uniref:hypothetical protein n=1 Tax='Cynodon dactylon' phytoplasma TaxID=295320 RepID=UPI001265D2EE|nr:hypothetical protein ['Cynodon dactylon' phytoplasma]KAB8121758.1 hypothetical protein F1741_01815 ['Cynodon dactylon' phytoplasma]
MNVCEVLLNLNDDNVLCFLPPQIIYFYPAQKGLVKEVIVTDLGTKKNHWWFYQNQILNKYQKYSLKHQKIIALLQFGQLRYMVTSFIKNLAIFIPKVMIVRVRGIFTACLSPIL